jgi:type I restriction enzyme S subunit
MRECQVVTLREVCDFKPPKAEVRSRLQPTDLVSFLPMEDLGILSKRAVPSRERLLAEVAGSYTYFANGDVLLAKITPCFENGKLGIARDLKNGVGFGSSEYVVCRPHPKLNAEYLFYFLAQEVFREEGASIMTGAVGHKRVPREYIEAQQILLPPLPEQHHIVKILDEVFEAIAQAKANTEKNLQNARELWETTLQATFKNSKWPVVVIDSVCSAIIDCVNKTAPIVEEPTPYKMIRTTNVRDGKISLERVNCVSEAVFAQWTRRQLPQVGDVILTREAPLGEVGMILTNDRVFLGQRLVSYRADPTQLDNEFLLYSFQEGRMKDQIRRLGSGATVQHMRVPDCSKLRLSIPPLGEQRRVVSRLDVVRTQTQSLEQIYRQKLLSFEGLKKAVLKKAFNGEL